MSTLDPTNIFAPRFASAAGIACLLYDHLLTFESERQAIWANPNANIFSKIGFVANRYGSEAVGIYVASVLSATRELDVSRCITFIWIYSICASVFVTVSHFAVIYRIYYLWDRRRIIGYILTISFFLVISTVCLLAVLSVLQIQPHAIYVAPLRSCDAGIKPKTFPAMLGIISLYDLFLIVLTIFNSLHVPRRHDIEIARSLRNDSAVAFLLLFLIRFANFLVSTVEDATSVFKLLPIVWLLCAVINARLQIRLEGLAIQGQSSPQIVDTECDVARVWLVTLPEINHSAFWGDLDHFDKPGPLKN
jgi:hypothetical protein